MRNITRDVPEFESEAYKEKFFRCLWSGVVPPKFSYSGSAAYSHAALAATPGYRAITEAVKLEAGMVLSHLELAGECQIAEVGPGTGYHTIDIIKTVSTVRNDLQIRYLGLDFSVTLLDIARPVLENATTLGLKTAEWDVDEGPTDAIRRWRANGIVHTLMVGNTLANLDDPAVALRNIRESLAAGDTLLLSVNLVGDKPDPAEITSPYRTPEFRATVLEPFRAAGVDIDTFDILYEDSEVMAFVTLGANYYHERDTLPAGQRIRCFRSRRFSQDTFIGYLKESGFSSSATYLRRAGDLAVALAVIELFLPCDLTAGVRRILASQNRKVVADGKSGCSARNSQHLWKCCPDVRHLVSSTCRRSH